MMMPLISIILLLLQSSTAAPLSSTVPGTTSGRLHGERLSIGSLMVDRYLGVPYAKPPVGELRFRAPETLDSSHARQDLSTVTMGPSCLQPPPLRRVVYESLWPGNNGTYSEDCLTINIFAPASNVSKVHETPKAVLVWVPGEGFNYGDANQYDGSNLAAHADVVVVTVHYRLSVFGFLTTGDGLVPGNLALMDIAAALRWVRDNSRALNVDPERVTLFGRFTGSMAISALLASPYSLDDNGMPLFQRAVLQSGVAHGKWVFETDPVAQVRQLASRLNISQDLDMETIIARLRLVPSSDLHREAFAVTSPWRLSPSSGAVLVGDDSAVKEISNRGLRLILGQSVDEGSLCLLTHMALGTPYLSRLEDDVLTVDDLRSLAHHHAEDYVKVPGATERVAAAALKQYSCSKSSCRSQFLQMCGDLYSGAAITSLRRSLVKHHVPIYSYQFTHRPSFSHFPKYIDAAQGDEVPFVFGLLDHPSTSRKATTEERHLSHTMMQAYGNFAKTGNPNPIMDKVPWPTFNDFGEVLNLQVPSATVRPFSPSRQLNFWMKIVETDPRQTPNVYL